MGKKLLNIELNSFLLILNFPYDKAIKYKSSRNFTKGITFILYSFLLISFPEQLLLYDHFIEIKVNTVGLNQILSDQYTGNYPYVSDIGINDKYYNFSSVDDIIRFEWSNTFSDFSYMFNDLKTITYIKIHNMFSSNIKLSYMFGNCINLENFSISTNIGEHYVEKLDGMFYNCTKLTTLNFSPYLTTYPINMSRMFLTVIIYKILLLITKIPIFILMIYHLCFIIAHH